jgi:hypothetical protein
MLLSLLWSEGRAKEERRRSDKKTRENPFYRTKTLLSQYPDVWKQRVWERNPALNKRVKIENCVLNRNVIFPKNEVLGEIILTGWFYIIHFDDYFYPDPSSAGIMVSDNDDYIKYGAGYSTIQEFRRANVDKSIKGVYDVIVNTKPEVVFSISPTANNEYNFNTLYADVTKWCRESWIDVVIP